MQDNKKSDVRTIATIILLALSLLAMIGSLGRVLSIETSLRRYSYDLASLKTYDSNEIQRLEEHIKMLEAKVATNKKISSKREESDIGSWARALFTEQGLKIESYRTSKSGGVVLFEFTISGTLRAFIAALQKASAENTPKIASFRLTAAPDGKITSTVRIGNE